MTLTLQILALSPNPQRKKKNRLPESQGEERQSESRRSGQSKEGWEDR